SCAFRPEPRTAFTYSPITRPGTSPPSLEFPPRALLGGQDLETRGPPAGPYRLDELRGKRLLLHLARQRLRVVRHRDEFGLFLPLREQGVPDLAAPVVRRPSHGARVHDPAAVGQRALPVDPGVRAENR